MLKNKSLIQFIKFGLVGVSNTLVSQVVYMICYNAFGLYPLISNAIAFIISVFWAFCWQNRFVFKEEENAGKRIWWQVLFKTYCAYAFTGLFLNSVLLEMWMRAVHLENFTPPLTDYVNSLGISISNYDLAVNIAPLLNIVINVPLNFVINKFWAYRQKKSPADNAGKAEA